MVNAPNARDAQAGGTRDHARHKEHKEYEEAQNAVTHPTYGPGGPRPHRRPALRGGIPALADNHVDDATDRHTATVTPGDVWPKDVWPKDVYPKVP
jgi:hypothetical protein